MAKGLITLVTPGNFIKTATYFNKLRNLQTLSVLTKYGDRGVLALSGATPVDSGETAGAWFYTIESKSGVYSISFHNSHVEDGAPIAILLQYGHATRTGGYVIGRDYINPAIRPIFDAIKTEAWREVTSL